MPKLVPMMLQTRFPRPLRDIGNDQTLAFEPPVPAAAACLRRRQPHIDALVLDCTRLPPQADTLRHATGVPVCDAVTTIERRMARQAETARPDPRGTRP